MSAGTCASPTTTVAAYGYDAQGRRKSKTVGATTTYYATDADNREVLEYSGAGALQNWYAFALGPDAVLNQMNVAGSTRATPIPDVIGSVLGSLDAASGTLTKFGYQPFGENPSLTSGGYRYTARRLDPETLAFTSQPSGLYYYPARMYAPGWGRFLQADPSGYPAGTNLYAYVFNDPLNLTDPLGLCDNPGCGSSSNQFIASPTTPVVTNPMEALSPIQLASLTPSTSVLGSSQNRQSSGVVIPYQDAAALGLPAEGSPAQTIQTADIASELEALGGGVPLSVPTAKGASQFIFPNGTILRFDLSPGQYLGGQGPHINLETPGGGNLHIPLQP